MSKKNYCSCPYCESVFVLRSSISKVICGNCGELFDANLNLVVRVGNKFVPDVSIPPADTSVSEQSADAESAISRQSRHAHNRESDINLKIEAKGEPAGRNRRPGFSQEPAVAEERTETDPNRLKDNQNQHSIERSQAGDSATLTGSHGHSRGKLKPKRKYPWQTSAISPDSPHGFDQKLKQKNQVNDLMADRKNPFSTIAWSTVTIAFLSILVVQIEAFAIPKYAQDSKYRPYLSAFCKIVRCTLPLYKDAANLTLMHTTIEFHPSEPGAVRIAVKLVNEAEHPQPYPEIQLTLTDKFGRVVGKRIYEPSVYLLGDAENIMNPGQLSSVFLDLAKPHENAHGFTVDVVDGI